MPGTALAAGFLSAPPSEKEDLGSPGTLIPLQVSAIIPAVPNASGVKLKAKRSPHAETCTSLLVLWLYNCD